MKQQIHKIRNWLFTPRGAAIYMGVSYGLVLVWMLYIRRKNLTISRSGVYPQGWLMPHDCAGLAVHGATFGIHASRPGEPLDTLIPK